MTSKRSPVIIGAGPAGLATARALVEAGLRPIVLEEGNRPGGQGTRRLCPLMSGETERFMGRRAAASSLARETDEDDVLAACDWRPNTLVWAIFADRLETIRDGHHASIHFDQLMIAAGATDRIMALPGWTLPGVFSLGGAQVALKAHASFIGERVVLAGSSPLLYLAAAQYARMGARDLTVVDTAQASGKRKAAFGMAMTSPGTLFEGVQLLYELRRHGVRHIEGATLVEVQGTDRVEALHIRHRDGSSEKIDCDAVAIGYGLRPETQLAELAGADFRFDETLRNWFPVIDADGRAGPALWLAGDGAMIGGRIAAAKSGRLAGLSMLAARTGTPVDGPEAKRLRKSVAQLRRFQLHMAGAFPWPHEAARSLPDDTIVCRCERITAGEIRRAIDKVAGPVEVNRVKAVTRCGMGRCQGRFCGPTLQELTAATAQRPVAEVGRLRAQAPVRPIPIAAAGDGMEKP
jgi:NADPH-dependent 2,4-dienoyl-CoA reductase/sulfur reductase-like enzyme